MTKPSFLSGLKAAAETAAQAIFPPDLTLDREVAELETKLTALNASRDKLVLELRRELPGSAERLMRHDEERQRITMALADARAAQRAQQAEEATRVAKAAAAAVQRDDRAAQAAFDLLASVAGEMETVIGPFVSVWAKLQDAQSACRDHLARNPRMRDDLMHTLTGLQGRVGQEIARQAVAAKLGGNAMPPGVNTLALSIGDPSTWPPISRSFADLAKACFRRAD